MILTGLLLALAVPADASKPRLRLERIDASEFENDGTVRVFASVVELEGNIDDGRAGPMFRLKMNGKVVGKPEKGQQFQGANEALDLVLIVEASALYGPKKIVAPPPPPPLPKGQKPPRPPKAPKGGKAATGKGKKLAPEQHKQQVVDSGGGEPLEKVKDAVHALLESLSPKVRVLLIEYGGDLVAHAPFKPAGAVSGDVDELLPDGEAGDLALTRAISAGLVELGRPRPDGKSARRLIVVVSDGLNSQMDRKTFKILGDAAARARVPIHTIAFSPNDERGPLLNLGEMSKRSNGTFRWARTADDLRGQIETLGDELNKQYVLTFKIDTRSLEHKRFELVCEDLVSNPLVYDSSGGSFGYAPATRPLVPWWLWAIAGLVLFGGGAAVVLARARPKAKKQMKFSPYKAADSRPPSADGAGSAARGAIPSAARASGPVGSGPVGSGPVGSGPVGSGPVRPSGVVPEAAVVRAPTSGILIVVSGALAGQRVTVGAQPVTVGKGPSTLQISDDPTVSTRHAELALRGGAFVVTDLGSTNGTFLNSQRITQPTRISDGDLLRFGNTQMKFRTE
ncbi:MAG: domain containing protein [Myxococcales bacterium]|nr:domain containing protein [Myxococcales bacterium]